ncbi:MAG: abortive infection family protein [Janthinobacterium lividum]
MAGGFVLDFSDRALQGFVADSVGLDILAEKYKVHSGSKAYRLRALWNQEDDQVTGKLLQDLLSAIPEYWARVEESTGDSIPAEERQAFEAAQQACERLLGGAQVEYLDSLTAVAYDENFKVLGKQLKGSIEGGEPQVALDRLHTFLIKYFRHLCERHGIATTRDEALHAVFGKYLKGLTAAGKIKSEMSSHILRYAITILSSFNYVRNNQSLAHDNEMLNREESLLIFRNITALMKFIEFIEQAN